MYELIIQRKPSNDFDIGLSNITFIIVKTRHQDYQKENQNINQMIVSGNTPSPVALRQIMK